MSQQKYIFLKPQKLNFSWKLVCICISLQFHEFFEKQLFKLFTFSKYIISSVKDDLARCRLGYASTAICDIALILLMQTSNISFMNEMKNTLRIFILMYHSKNANSWIFFGMKMFHCFNMDFILVQLFIARFSSIYHFLSLFML